jgi:hypothetical protein
VDHRIPTEHISLAKNETESIRSVMEQNDHKGFKIEDIFWPKGRNEPLGKSAFLGMRFDTAESSEQIINSQAWCVLAANTDAQDGTESPCELNWVCSRRLDFFSGFLF